MKPRKNRELGFDYLICQTNEAGKHVTDKYKVPTNETAQGDLIPILIH